MGILNDRIKECRTDKNLTLIEVAEYLGVKEATAQRYESGEIKNIKHETIASLAELFDCDPSYLMGWTNAKNQLTNIMISKKEKELMKKYSSLDDKGKHTVDTVLDMEYNRIHKPYLVPVAAHNDDESDEQLELMRQDIEDLKKR